MMLTDWWMRLEAAPCFGGPRRHVHNLLGADLASFLETAGVLRQVGITPNYPCEERAGDHCPRILIEIDGGYHAVCGNRPRGCRDLILTEREAALLSTDMLALCKMLGAALGVRGSPERTQDLNGVHRIGSIIPEPGIRYSVYLVIRSNPQSYVEAFGALVRRQQARLFSMLVPTSRFITDQLEQEAGTIGAVILPLADVLTPDGDRMCSAADPAALFSFLGQRPKGSFGAAGEIVAEAMVCNGQSPPRWRDLDEAAYRALVADANNFNVFADEQAKIVQKGNIDARQINTATASHFQLIRLAVDRHGYFDPVQNDPRSRASAQQIFQRARKLFDPRTGSGPWRLFKTVDGEDGAVYHFNPDAGVSFAFIFLPQS